MKRFLTFLLAILMMTVAVSAQPTLPTINDITVDKTDTVLLNITLLANPDNGSAVWDTDFAFVVTESDDNHSVFTWVTTAGDVGVYSVEINVSDLDSTDTKTFTITVVNNAPAITSTAVTTAIVNRSYTYDVDATDADSVDTLTYSLVTAPSGMTIDGSTGVITWTPSSTGAFSVAVNVSDGTDSDSQAYTLTVSPQTATLSLSEVNLGGSSQQRDENDTAILTVTNTGSETVTGINLTSSANADYQVSFSQTTIASLAAGASTQITVEAYVPDDKDSESERIATITARGTSSLGAVTATSDMNMEAENMLLIYDLDVKVNGRSKDVDDGESVEVFPGAEIEVTIVVKNYYSKSTDIQMEDVEVMVFSDDIDVDETDDIRKIRDGNKESITLTFSIDIDEDSGTYDIEVTVEGDDENGAKHTDTWDIEFDLTEEGIIITSLRLNPESLRCGDDSFDVEFDLTNVEDDDVEDAAFDLEVKGLGYEKRVTRVEILDEDTITKSYTIVIPEDAEPGIHLVSLKAYIDFDELTHTRYASVTIPSGCEDVAEEDEEEQEDEVADDFTFVGDSEGEDTEEKGFSSFWTTLLLVWANILILLVIAILVIKFLL